jgi:hypothetical protein
MPMVAMWCAMTNRNGKKRSGGKPPFRPTKEQRFAVETMAGCLVAHEDIAAATLNPYTGHGISVSTLHKVFRKELDAGRGAMRRDCSISLRKLVNAGNITAVIWAQKNLMLWRDRLDHAHAFGERGDGNEVVVHVGFVKAADGEPTPLRDVTPRPPDRQPPLIEHRPQPVMPPIDPGPDDSGRRGNW